MGARRGSESALPRLVTGWRRNSPLAPTRMKGWNEVGRAEGIRPREELFASASKVTHRYG